ncbi:hypothetical protein [uncultured Sphingomonas sp.]|uniref:hypothetical protein n=1 Tax=uncultured Sphingomonas sp. TaxID=158754 RepID=UPI00374A95D9
MVAIVAVQNTTVAPRGGGVWRITKTGGFDDSFDAPAKSVAAITGDFVLRAKRVGDADRLMIGVTANPDEDTGYVGIDYAIAYRSGAIEVFERGEYRAYSFDIADFVWIERIGTTLRYLTGPSRKSASVVRTVTGVAGPLFFDSSLVTPGCAVDVRFDRAGWDIARPRTRLSLAI